MIITTDHGAVRELRMNRPPVNALNGELLRATRGAVETASKEGARAIVISGAPGMFTAGLDVPALIKLDRTGMTQLWGDLYGLMKALATSPIPICAAITGHAPAGGTVIAIFCDYRVCAQGDFKLGLSEVQAGIPIPPVILKAASRLVGPRQAERMTVAGLLLSPEQSFELGLVDELTAPDQVVGRAVAWCESLLALPSNAMSSSRKLARADLAGLFESEMGDELKIVLDGWFSTETQVVLQEMVKRLGKA